MERRVNTHEQRELLKLAKQLRASASATENYEYIGLFLRAAMALEERASLSAFGASEIVPPEADQALLGRTGANRFPR